MQYNLQIRLGQCVGRFSAKSSGHTARHSFSFRGRNIVFTHSGTMYVHGFNYFKKYPLLGVFLASR
jgi:hypothetical protein